MPNQIRFDQINRSDRARIEYPDIEELAQSLYTQGFIHPIAVNQNQVLVAGGRRSAALQHLIDNPEDFPYESAHPDMRGLLRTGALFEGLHYTVKPTTSEDHLRELELIENVQRQAFTWQEEVIAVSKIHSLKKRAGALEQEPWGQRETGKLLKMSSANVNYCTKLAKTLTSDPDHAIWKCSGVSEALAHLASERFDEANKLLVSNAQSRAKILPDLQVSSDSTFFSDFNPSADEGDHITDQMVADYKNRPDQDYGTPEGKLLPESGSISEQDQASKLALSMVYNMDCLDFFKHLGPESVDHIITDPPYGIEMGNLSQSNAGQNHIDRIADTHGVEDNMSNFEHWLVGCYHILRDKGFCVWWCDVSQFENIKSLAQKVGFKVQSWPLTWVKTSNCMNQRAEYNFTKTTEVAIVMRKGDARLVSAQQTCVWTGALTPRCKEVFAKHPFIKPEPAWAWLLSALALPGSTVCDPFSGVGSFTRAAFKLGYHPVCCEIDDRHHAQQVQVLTKTIERMQGNE